VAAATGFPWVKAVSDLFAVGPGQTTSNGTLTPPQLIMSFTHDNNLPPVVAALGLWNTSSSRGVYPLSLTTPNPARTFRSSYLVAFRGYVALERMSCARDSESDVVKHVSNQLPIPGEKDIFVRVLINRAPVPVPGCSSGPGATCPLHQFLSYVQQRGVASGDFVQTCGLQGVANATSVASFLTTTPDPASVQVLSL